MRYSFPPHQRKIEFVLPAAFAESFRGNFPCGFAVEQSTMNNPFEEIFKRLENIEKMISPVGSSSSEEPDSRQSVLVKISVASRITGYSVNYLYHLASSGAIPYVKRGRSLRFDVNELQQWMQQQYIPASNKLSDERKKE